MKINGIEALQEEIQGNVYSMTFPRVPDTLNAPFVVTTTEGDEVHTISDFTIPLQKLIDLATGQTVVVFGKSDERDLKIASLEEQLEAEQAFSALLESLSLAAPMKGGTGDE
ncbi:MAG: hypothetical protein FWD84_01180 [Oscillospiraceae bacterium]|nr:hypothetical protein [Oscillospiraceae bacterium]